MGPQEEGNWVILVVVLGDVSEAWFPESLHLGQLDRER